jgi:hypothetical protein
VAFGGNQILTTSNPAGGADTWTVQYTNPAPPPSPCPAKCGTPPNTIHALSCPSATLCVAVDNEGDVLSSSNPTGGASAWNSTHLPYVLGGVSCPSASFCAISAGNNVLTSSSPASGTWAATPVPQGAPQIFPGSCASAQLCVGAGRAPAVFTQTPNGDLVLSTNPAGGSWATADTDHFPALSLNITEALEPSYPPGSHDYLGITGVSCPSPSLCVAIDGLGRVVVGHATSA